MFSEFVSQYFMEQMATGVDNYYKNCVYFLIIGEGGRNTNNGFVGANRSVFIKRTKIVISLRAIHHETSSYVMVLYSGELAGVGVLGVFQSQANLLGHHTNITFITPYLLCLLL